MPIQDLKPLKVNENRILKAHNYYRDIVKVPPLEWSEELTIKAQEIADSMAHNCSIHEVDADFGGNYYWTKLDRTEEEVVDYWAKERKWFDRQGHTRFTEEDGGTYAHYTQIIWEGTTHMGAGRQRCDNGQEIWVCLYNPKGNEVGALVY